MATIGDFWQIDYINKRVYYENQDPSVGPDVVYTVNALYSYLQDVFDDLDQMDDYVPMTAQTPTAYTLVNGWFVDDESVKFLNGGAITQANNSKDLILIYFLQCAAANWINFVSSDIGAVYTGSDSGDSGVLLGYDNTNYKIFLRSVDTGDTFADADELFTATDPSNAIGEARNIAAGAEEESLFANVYTLGTLATLPEPQIYIFQDGEAIIEWSDLTNWDRGHIDILVKVKEGSAEIDSGLITVFSRQLGDLYDNFEIDLTAGGRNAVPLATATDLDNASGSHYLLVDGDSGTFDTGEIITDGTSGATAEVVSYTQLIDVANTGVLVLAGIKGTFGNNNTITGDTSGETGSVNGTVGDTYLEYISEAVASITVGNVVTGGTSTAKRVVTGKQDDTDNTGFLVLQVDSAQTGDNRVPYYKDFTNGETITDGSTSATAVVDQGDSTTITSGYDNITITFVTGTADYDSGNLTEFILNERISWTGGEGIVLYDDSLASATGTLTIGNVQNPSTITTGSLVVTGDSSGATVEWNSTITYANTIDKNFEGVTSQYPYDVVIECGKLYSHVDQIGEGRYLADVYEYLKYVCGEDSTFSMYTTPGGSAQLILDGEEYIQAQSGYAPSKASPIGTFAGGTLFGAQSVFLVGMHGDDAQAFSLVDANGAVRTPPNYQSITITSLETDDTVSVFRSISGGSTDVEKDQYGIVAPLGTYNGNGDTELKVDVTLPAYTPTTGFVRIVDDDLDVEYRIAYTSFSVDTFTISTPLSVDLTTSDTAYVPFIDNIYTTSASVSVIYDAVGDAALVPVPLVVRVRKKTFLPFETTGSYVSTGTIIGAIRTPDSIVTP